MFNSAEGYVTSQVSRQAYQFYFHHKGVVSFILSNQNQASHSHAVGWDTTDKKTIIENRRQFDSMYFDFQKY